MFWEAKYEFAKCAKEQSVLRSKVCVSRWDDQPTSFQACAHSFKPGKALASVPNLSLNEQEYRQIEIWKKPSWNQKIPVLAEYCNIDLLIEERNQKIYREEEKRDNK